MVEQKRERIPGFLHSRIISIISISMMLFLVGVVVTLGLVGAELGSYIREKFSFTILLSSEVKDEDITKMKHSLKKEPFVKSLLFHSKEEALKELTEALGENPEEFLMWNPLLPSFEVFIPSSYMAQKDSVAFVLKKLEAYPLVDKVMYKKDFLEELNENIRTISFWIGGGALLLLLISIVLINNTIRLLIYSKRFLIYTMKLVGATPAFIRRPFVWSSVGNGIISAILALLLLAWSWYHIISVYPVLRSLLTYEMWGVVASVVLALAVLLSAFSAVIAVGKYIYMDANKLYRV